MPINASFEYQKAEEKYLQAKTIPEKVKCLEEMLKTAPKHKGAEVLVASIKSRLAKFRNLLDKEKQQRGKGFQISVKKEGSAQVVIVGLTNSGKSLLLSKLTNAKPEVAEYPHTTEKPEVGILEYEGVSIQMVEIPSIYKDFAYKGKGPQYFSIIRNCDLVIVLLDKTKNLDKQKDLIFNEFEKAQIKLNKKRPNIKIKKNSFGGINIVGESLVQGPIEEAKKMIQDQGFHNVNIEIYERVKLDELIEVMNESIAYLPSLIVINKDDFNKEKEFSISALKKINLDKLKKNIWEHLGLIRVFTKTPGKERDYPPVTLNKKSKVKDLARVIHKDFVKKFKFARVWGKSIRFDGATVGLDHELKDMDIVELHLK